MLDHNELKPGVQFIFEGDPCIVVVSSFTYKARGSSTVQTKIKNLKTGATITRTFHAGDALEEAELEKRDITFVYENRGKYIFSEKNNPTKRFELSEEQIGGQRNYLIPNTVLEGLVFEGKIINVSLPIKMNIRVTDAPPGIKGDRAQGGNKTVTLETGMAINTPLFVETGDIIEVNTQSGEYVRRIEKA